MKLNPKTKLAERLASVSSALAPADLPQDPTPAFLWAKSALYDALEHFFTSLDIIDYDYDTSSKEWYATVKVESVLNSHRDICPYYIKGEVSASATTPLECVTKIIGAHNEAVEWQRRVIGLLKADAARNP